MNRKIFILLFLFIALISVSAVSAADLDDNNETIVSSDIGVEKLSVSNDVNAIDDLNKDDAGSEAVLENAVKSSAAGEKEILSVGDSDSDVLGVKESKIYIDDAYYEKFGSDYKIIVTGYVRDADDEFIDKGTVSIYLNEELKRSCDVEFGMFSGEVDVGPGKYDVRVRYHDDSGDYYDNTKDYDDNPIIIKAPEPVTWYVDGSKSYGGGGKSEADAFSTLNEALYAANNNDTVKIAAGTYAGGANIGGYIQKILTFEKYGDGEAIFDGEGQRIWSVGVDTINIYGLTFINGGGDNGGALYFLYGVSNSVINATFRDNSVTGYGGAIYVDNSVSNLTLRSTFINNTAGNNGAGVYIGGNADNVKVYGEYRNNAASQSGVIYANKTFSSSVIDATFINNTAKNLGGAFCFNGDLTGVDISGKFINNNGGDSIIYVANSVSGNSIHDSVFLNNEAYKIFSVNDGEITTAKDNWFGSDASNYYKIPEDVGIDLENWLFLNATADPSELEADEKSAIIFKLSSFDGSEIIDYDASKMNIVLNLSQTLGALDKTSASIGENITYTAKDSGNATVTGKFETASYTVSLTNSDPRTPTSINVTNSTVDLKVNGEIAAGATLTPADAGNLTYTSSNSSVAVVVNGKIKALAAGSANITVSFAGDETYAPSSNTIAVTVTLNDASLSVNNATLDLLIDDEFVLVATTTPEGLNVTFTPDNSGVVSVDEKGVVTALKEGEASVKVSVGGDGVYALNSTDVTVTVNKIPSEIIANDTLNMSIDDVASDVASLKPAAAGNVTYVSGNSSVVKVEGDKLVAVAEGTAIVLVNFAGNDKYEAAVSKVIMVNVTKVETSIDVDVDNIKMTIGGNAKINATVNPEDAGELDYTSSDVSVVTVNGIGELTAVGDGTAVITVRVIGDDKYLPSSKNVTVTVGKKASKFAEISIVKNNVTMILSDENGNPISGANISYTVNGASNTTVSDDNGSFVIIGEPGASIAVNYPGNNVYLASNITIQLTPVRQSTVIIGENFTQYAVDYYAGERGQNFTVQLKDADGNVLANKTVFIGYNGKTLERTTDAKGYASVQINLKDKNRLTFAVTFLGDEKYNATMSVYLITIKQKPVTISASAKTYKATAKTKKYTVTLKTVKGASADGKTYFKSGKKVTMKLNGKTYTAKTNAKGQATFSLKITKKGKFTAVVKYAGDNTYKSASKSVKITIK